VGIANWAVVGIQVPIQVMNGEAVSIPGSYGWADPASNPIRGLSYQGLGDISIHGKVRLLRAAERDPVGLAVVARIGLPTGQRQPLRGRSQREPLALGGHGGAHEPGPELQRAVAHPLLARVRLPRGVR
jgi:hypothetical protein